MVILPFPKYIPGIDTLSGWNLGPVKRYRSKEGQVKTSETALPPLLTPVKMINQKECISGKDSSIISTTPKIQKDSGMVVRILS